MPLAVVRGPLRDSRWAEREPDWSHYRPVYTCGRSGAAVANENVTTYDLYSSTSRLRDGTGMLGREAIRLVRDDSELTAGERR
jgi:hypothetical protein